MGKDEKNGEEEKEREQEIEKKPKQRKNYGITVHFPAGLCERPSPSVPLICHR